MVAADLRGYRIKEKTQEEKDCVLNPQGLEKKQATNGSDPKRKTRNTEGIAPNHTVFLILRSDPRERGDGAVITRNVMVILMRIFL